MFAEYVQAALRHAKYEVLEDDTYMATVEGLRGVIAVQVLKEAGIGRADWLQAA